MNYDDPVDPNVWEQPLPHICGTCDTQVMVKRVGAAAWTINESWFIAATEPVCPFCGSNVAMSTDNIGIDMTAGWVAFAQSIAGPRRYSIG